MSDVVFNECRDKMHNSVEAVRREFSKLRAGKATPALLEGILVDAYGSQTPMNQVGTVGAPEPRLLVVQPWDKSLIGAIERAIQASDLGLNPMNDGQVIRVPIPALTEERRRDLVKVAKGYAEEGRIAVRNARRDANDALKREQKANDITEDEEKKAHARIQEMTDQHVKEIDAVFASKEQEILEI
ncbi:MAG: ribosome-recycling factor [Gemmatimonadota bacterium]|nr:MAG: ribosome-recycling factor [Gemmatimonadota bacterium]